jgi:hypothetical protein
MSIYHNKYIKYKNKYLSKKNSINQTGGKLLQNTQDTGAGVYTNYPKLGKSWGEMYHDTGDYADSDYLFNIFKNGMFDHYVNNVRINEKYKKYFVKVYYPVIEKMADNDILKQLGIIYQRLKIVVEKKLKFVEELRTSKKYGPTHPKYIVYRDITNNIDKFVTMIQTMIHNHIIMILKDTVTQIPKLKILEYNLDEEINNIIGDIPFDMDHMDDINENLYYQYNIKIDLEKIKESLSKNPSFYEEPEYQTIIKHLSELSKPVSSDGLRYYTLPEEIALIVSRGNEDILKTMIELNKYKSGPVSGLVSGPVSGLVSGLVSGQGPVIQKDESGKNYYKVIPDIDVPIYTFNEAKFAGYCLDKKTEEIEKNYKGVMTIDDEEYDYFISTDPFTMTCAQNYDKHLEKNSDGKYVVIN